ncbi:MAG: hypothetical protein CSB48_11780 [Proteobacteria bacterium]|nr:MAG: hypothetical protein CSB48_11780 [Pseudomonadota bacterium]
MDTLSVSGNNTASIYEVDTGGLSASANAIYEILKKRLVAKGFDTFIDCSGEDAGCGFYMPRRLAPTGPKMVFYDAFPGFWNLNSGSFFMYTGRLHKKSEDFYIALVVSEDIVNRKVFYSVDLLRVSEPPQGITFDHALLPVRGESRPVKIPVQTVYFEFGSTVVTDSFLDDIARLVTELKRNPGRLALVGHADKYGDPVKNEQLSFERALSVARLMTEKGVPRADLVTIGLGASHPVGGKARVNNRRVEIMPLAELAAD